MKKVLVLIITLLMVFTNTVLAEVNLPNSTSEFYVNDFANILDYSVEERIINKNKSYEKTEVEPQIVVATIESLEGIDIETYSVELLEKWKIGNKEYNNGVLLLIAEQEKEIRIEVGYGLEGAITDAEAGRIIDSGMKDFTEGNYDLAIRTIFLGITDEVEEEYGVEGLKEVKDSSSSEGKSETLIKIVRWFNELPLFAKIVIIIALIAFFIIDFTLFGGNITMLILRIILAGGKGSGGSKGGGGRSGGGGSSR